MQIAVWQQETEGSLSPKHDMLNWNIDFGKRYAQELEEDFLLVERSTTDQQGFICQLAAHAFSLRAFTIAFVTG